MGSIVHVMPLSDGELVRAHELIARLSWELEGAQLAALSGIGLRRRRIFLVRDPMGAWLIDAMEGDGLVGLGPEAVWATSACGIDRWVAERDDRSYIGDLSSLPEADPSLDLRLPLPVRAVPSAEDVATDCRRA